VTRSVAWIAPPLTLSATHRTIRATGRFVTTAPVEIDWQVLDPIHNNPIVTGPKVTVDGDEYVGATITVPSEWDVVQVCYGLVPTAAATVVKASELSARIGSEEHLERPRFVGTITDLSTQVEGSVLQTQVQCIGLLARFGEKFIGDAPFPIETDAARATRIAALVAEGFVANGSTQVRLNPRDVDRKKAADVLREQAGSTGALLWESPDGTIHYDSSESRGLNETPPPRLAGSEIIADVEWRQEMSRFIPRVIVEYGLDPGEGADRPIYAAGTGVETKINTELNDAASAKLVGDLILRRWGKPEIWDAPRVHTSTQVLTDGGYEAVLAAQPGDVIETDLMASEPEVGGSAGRWFVEGWTETWDGDPLVHSVNMSVSDYRRFTLAGDDPNMTLTASSKAWVFNGPDITFTARLDPSIQSGTVGLYRGGQEIGAKKTVVNGAVSWVVKGSMIPVGTHNIEARFSGVFAYWQADTALTQVSVSPSTAANVTFTATPTVVGEGYTYTLAATVSNPAGAPGKGTVQWFYSKNGGSSWSPSNTHRLPANGKVSQGTKANSPDAVWQWKARYTPDAGQGMVVTDSAPVAVDVQRKETKTYTYTGTWGQSYAQTGGLISSTRIAQGRDPANPSFGDQRGLVGFAIDPNHWKGYSITKVEVYFYWHYWTPNAIRNVRLYSHTHVNAPPSSSTPPAVTYRQWVNGVAIGSKWVDVTAWGKGFATGTLKGYSIGPSTSAGSSYFGWAQAPSQPNKPKVRITGVRWV
jgi:hypothetical protein